MSVAIVTGPFLATIIYLWNGRSSTTQIWCADWR